MGACAGALCGWEGAPVRAPGGAVGSLPILSTLPPNSTSQKVNSGRENELWITFRSWEAQQNKPMSPQGTR